MSADNWATCPRCAHLRRLRITDLEDKVGASYGVLTLEEFDDLRGQLAVERELVDNPQVSLREDYEIYGAEEGEVLVSYRASCAVCGLNHTFTHTSQIPL